MAEFLRDWGGGRIPFLGLGALSRPFGFAAGVGHAQIPLPYSSAGPLAFGARPLHGVAAALGTVQRNVAVRPGNAAGEATIQLVPQLLDGEDRFGRVVVAPGGDVLQAVAQSGQGAMA